MNVLLWVFQVALTLLSFAGGATKCSCSMSSQRSRRRARSRAVRGARSACSRCCARPANCPEYREVDASPDSPRRRRARTGMPGPRWIVRAIFAETDRYQPAGLGRRNGADGGIRGLWSVRAQAAGLTPCRDAVSAQRLLRSNKSLQPTPWHATQRAAWEAIRQGKRWLGSAPESHR